MKTSFNKQRYTPSSELVRVSQEKARNHNRRNDYLEKKGELDVSDDQEPSDYDKVLSADPEFAKFLDSLDGENRPF